MAQPTIPARPQAIDAVLPLVLADWARFEMLAESLDRNCPDLGTCLVVAPDRDEHEIRRRIGTSRFQVLADSDLLPELHVYRRALGSLGRRVTGWQVQQLVKLGVTDHIATDFYLTFDADVVCVKPVRYHDLIRNGVAIVRTSRNDYHPDWYLQAERILGMSRSGLTHGVTPAIFSREAVVRLQNYLEERVSPGLKALGLMWPGVARLARSWRALLLRNIPWTEYSLYHTFLEGSGLASRYHSYLGEDVLYDGRASLWRPADIADWKTPATVAEDCWFIVAQSNTGIPVDVVKDRLGQTEG